MDSVYSTMDISKIDIPLEIERWESVLKTNEHHIINYPSDSLMYQSIIDAAKQNLEYLRSIPLPD